MLTSTAFHLVKKYQSISKKVKHSSSKLIAISEPNDEGNCKVFFELNGQPRDVLVPNKKIAASVAVRAQADETNVNHVGAPMPGMIVKCMVAPGDKVEKNDPLADYGSYENGNFYLC